MDVILVEPQDRVPMLLDMTVKEIRHRMNRHRRGKQLFLPRMSYKNDNYNGSQQARQRRHSKYRDDAGSDLPVADAVGAGDLELVDVGGEGKDTSSTPI